MVIVADGSLDDMLADAGFDIIQKHTDRVHGSLTRHIFVCQSQGKYISNAA
jgi:tRNA G10  N-methylase Trm11